MRPALMAGVPIRVAAPLATVVGCALAVGEFPAVRRAVSLTLQIVWMYFVAGSRG